MGGLKDGAGRAVVLFQLDDKRAGKVPFEVQDVREVGAPPAINALPVVAYHADVATWADEIFDDSVLRSVGILILIDHDVRELALPLAPDVIVLFEQSDGFKQ